MYKRLLRLQGQFPLQETGRFFLLFPANSVFQATHLNSHNMIANVYILVPTRNLHGTLQGVWSQPDTAHWDTTTGGELGLGLWDETPQLRLQGSVRECWNGTAVLATCHSQRGGCSPQPPCFPPRAELSGRASSKGRWLFSQERTGLIWLPRWASHRVFDTRATVG